MENQALIDCRDSLKNYARDLAVCLAYFAAGVASERDVLSAQDDYARRVVSYNILLARAANG
jgi:hypothetical protein